MTNIRLWTALITPMTSQCEIHFDDLEKCIRRQESAGNGILLLGSTGEGLALGEEEKKQIINFVSDRNNTVPIMAGVGGFNLQSQLEWVGFCNQKNVDAYLLVNPLYAKPGSEGQYHWFSSLLDQSEKPCMIYNIPSRTGIRLDPGALKRLQDHPNAWAVKEASGNIDDYQTYKNEAPELQFFSGDDALMPFFCVPGCHGLVSVASNVWPEATNLYVEKSIAGETESLFPVWKDAVAALFSSSNPVPAKILLNEKGVIETPELRPPLTVKDRPDMKALKRSDEDILNWYKKNK